ncbi:NAD-dependent epimerase/dehydratase family protein [Acidianus sp. RZ1]|uniref:NAD-dependent epimerase/dehydratase family protein n=1 Tax=Acidianus sp. RZ1 TaxID=1540082 RepID=UPI0014914A33|nr:NAD-dependent epimerase/dehydratase family protein [Acidianus sp. RZ1]NON61720.1 NAD-dependent epimerase/dehydratase family protein [Acidianus sp. RZ1]
MQLLVSGGAGFLGSHLIDDLVSKGENVTVVDNLSTIKHLYLPEKGVKLVKEKVENFDSSEKFDFVIHLAARPSPEDYMNNPVDTALSNSLGTQKLLEIARKNDATFVYTSSSEVYGNPSIVPTPEDYWGFVNPIGVRSCYDESKRFSEALIMAYHRQYNLDVRIQRPFNVYGPRLREDGTYGRVVSRFIYQALKGEDITIFGDGSQTRAFLYIDDWVDATERIIFTEGLSGEVFNVGSDKETKIIDLAKLILRVSNSRSMIKFLPSRVDDPPRRAADLHKIKEKLGWYPKTSLEEGIKKTVEWFGGAIN